MYQQNSKQLHLNITDTSCIRQNNTVCAVSSGCVARVCDHPMPCSCHLPGLTSVDLHWALLLAHAVSSTRGVTIILIAAIHAREDRRDEKEEQQQSDTMQGERRVQ